MNTATKMTGNPVSWQVQEAKNRFSEVIEQALRHGPQVVTRHGKPVVHVVSVADSAATTRPTDDGFATYLLSAPHVPEESDPVLQAPPRRTRKSPVRLG